MGHGRGDVPVRSHDVVGDRHSRSAPHPGAKIRSISRGSVTRVPDIKLTRTDTTLDLSQKAEKNAHGMATSCKSVLRIEAGGRDRERHGGVVAISLCAVSTSGRHAKPRQIGEGHPRSSRITSGKNGTYLSHSLTHSLTHSLKNAN